MTGDRPRLRTHHVPDTDAITTAAVAGPGWGLNPTLLVDPLIAAGQLVELQPGATRDMALTWQVPRQHRATLADLIRAIRYAARRALLPA